MKSILKAFAGFLLIVLSFAQCFGQTTIRSTPNKPVHLFQVKQYIIPCSSLFVSGILDGTGETISFHYKEFQNVFPKASAGYWNPAISWLNKYKNGNPAMGPRFFQSTQSLVFLTDGYHALRAGKNFINMGALVYYVDVNHNNKKFNWKKVVVDAIVFTAFRDAGFYLTYSDLFRIQ